MKISGFAEKFKVNVSTVRHYVNSGLLIPERKNGQYFFDKECENDMKNILRYKDYHFTLEEIQLLFFMEKASRFQDEVVMEVCAEILKNKHQELIKERNELEANIKSLEDDIAQMPEFRIVEDIKWGVPFSFIPNLYCPKCQVPLELDSARLSNNYLYSGDLRCDCGYKARIEDGVIISGEKRLDTPFKAFDNIESIMSLKEEFSHNYRGLMAKTYLYMRDNIYNEGEVPKIILAGPFTYNFLLEHMGKLGSNNSFVIIDPSIKRINKLKKIFSETEYDIVYFAGNTTDLPIRHSSLDIYIDDWSTSNTLFTFGEFHIEQIAPYLKKKAVVTGIFTGYQNAPVGLKNFKIDNPLFTPEKMKFDHLEYNWNKNNIHITDKRSFGFSNNTDKHFPRGIIGETIEVFGYTANKK